MIVICFFLERNVFPFRNFSYAFLLGSLFLLFRDSEFWICKYLIIYFWPAFVCDRRCSVIFIVPFTKQFDHHMERFVSFCSLFENQEERTYGGSATILPKRIDDSLCIFFSGSKHFYAIHFFFFIILNNDLYLHIHTYRIA